MARTRRTGLAAACLATIVAGSVGTHALAQGYDFEEGLDLEDEEEEVKPPPAQKPPPPPAQKPPPPAQKPPGGGMTFGDEDLGEPEKPPARPTPTTTPPVQPPRTQPPPPAATTPPPAQRDSMQFQGATVTTTGSARQRFEQAVSAFKSDRFDLAAVGFHEILSDPALEQFHPSAEYFMARCFFKLELYHLSLHYLNRILTQGTGHKFFKASIGWLVFIAHKVADESVVLDTIASFPNVTFPKKYADEFNLLLAKYHAQQDEPGRARKLAEQVEPASPFHPRARYVLGVIDYQAQRYQDAVNNFKVAIERMARRVAEDDEEEDRQLLEMSYLAMARLHYEAQRFQHAVYYYDKVSKGSALWLNALFEGAWAEFRQGFDEKALGNLLTVHAPFFTDFYYPESYILKAVIYFENCRYPEARKILDDFLAVFPPVHEELKRITSQGLPPEKYYEMLSDIQLKGPGGASALLTRILNLALSDKTFRRLNETVREIEAETARLGSLPSLKPTAANAVRAHGRAVLDEARARFVSQAGTVAQGKLLKERDALNDFVGQAYRVQFETATAEKEALEASMREQGGRVQLREYRHVVAVGDTEAYWPFDGEYWEDELGSYEYTLAKGCK